MANHKITFFGTPDIVIPVVQFLNQTGELTSVVTTPGESPVRTFCLAENLDIKILTPTAFDQETINQLKELDSDLFIVAAYGKILPQEVLDIPKFGSINIHPSLLPKYRGPSPIQNTILKGESVTGVTIIKMDQKMDHGPIITQRGLDLYDDDNYLILGTRLFLLSLPLLEEILPKIFNEELTETVQDESLATFTKMVKKEDGYFEIDNPPALDILDKMVRAYYPWPSVWTRWNDKVIKFFPDKKIQMEGKSITTYKDFLNGYSTFPLKDLLQ